MQSLSIEVAPGAYDIITDVRRELRALKLQLTLCDRQQVQSEQEQCGIADLNLLESMDEANGIMKQIEEDSSAMFLNYNDALKFNTFLQQACKRMNSIEERIRICMRLKKSYGRSITNNRWNVVFRFNFCLLYTSPSPRDRQKSRMPSSA